KPSNERSNYEPNWNTGEGISEEELLAKQQQYFEEEVAANELRKREINDAIDSPRKALEAAKADATAQPSKELVVYEAPVAGTPSNELVPYVAEAEDQPAPSDAKTEVITTPIQPGEQLDEEGELSPETEEGRKKLSRLARLLIWPSIKITQAHGYLQSRSEKSLAKRNEAKEQRDGESDEDYARRIRFHKIRGGITEAAILGAATAAMIITKSHSWDNVLPFLGDGSGNSGDLAAGPGVADKDSGGSGAGAEVNALNPEQLAQLSRQGETDFLATNGRVNHDFNDISGAELQNGQGHEGLFPGYDALMDQYDKSPHMLGAQLDQMHELGVVFPDNLGELNRLPGEPYDAYIDRVSDLMHNNSELHDNATKFTGEWLAENKAAPQDLVGDYQSAFIVPDGNGGWTVEWDPSVASVTDGDTFQPTGTTVDANGNTVHHGIRFPCGQPIKIIEGQVYEVSVPVASGVGNGPTLENHTTTTPGGEGGGEKPTPKPEVPTPKPEVPTPKPEVPTPKPEVPTPKPEVPQPEKDTSLTPDQEGVTVRPLEGDLTQHPDQEGNGTDSPDATTTTETGQTTTEDTGTEVTVGGADTSTTNETTTNSVESGMNGTNEGGAPAPNGTLDTSNI
ncbi:hypothetical protein I8H89_05135, partial [Candidatus Saccharibacteria bacterium]|nr:hypothetical protein [Candidatus Saccharibacteria bacterium]